MVAASFSLRFMTQAEACGYQHHINCVPIFLQFVYLCDKKERDEYEKFETTT